MDGFEEWLVDEVRKFPHLYDPSQRDYKDAQKHQNSCGEILFQCIRRTDHNLFLHLLLLRSKTKFKISFSSAKSNVSQYLAIFHELQVVTAVPLGNMEKPLRTRLVPNGFWHFV